MKRFALLLTLLPVVSGLGSCVHSARLYEPTRIENSDLTRTRPRRVAVLPYRGEKKHRPYFETVVSGLERHPSIESIRTNWSAPENGAGDSEYEPDCVVEIRPSAEYSGSGKNFFITFPGFLVFAHAWNGFIYHNEITTQLKFHSPRDGSELRRREIVTNYELHHCDFGRGFWASSGWFTPGYGIFTVLPATYMLTYDSDATAAFHELLREPYGGYVAEMLVRDLVEQEEGASPIPQLTARKH